MAEKIDEMRINTPMSDSPISNPQGSGDGLDSSSQKISKKNKKSRTKFFRNLTSLFGFRKKKSNSRPNPHDLQFVKVDPNSENRTAQAKIGKVFNTKMSSRLEELFDSWLSDTTDTYQTLKDRADRMSQLEFAVMNDPFLSMAADLYADEATQIDEIIGQLITIDCADPRMKQRMYNLLDQWGITQNRVRSAIYNLTVYGDSFWSNKITRDGVIRITPLDIYQVKERLEFNPARVAGDMALKKGDLVTALNRDSKLKMLLDTLEDEENEEFADLFDTRLFGFVIEDDLVAPPWNITHFRLNAEQSPFYPFGNPVFLKSLAPFRQLNSTMVLQSLARAMSFPVTVYEVATTPGMDEAQQFERVNEIREEYENIGEYHPGSDAYSVNTKLWVPRDLINLTMHKPDIDLNAIGDLELLQDRVAVASGVPKAYLVQEWGGFGNSALSLTEQWKPFARRVFTVQSAFIEGLSNLFRLHFAITGEFDYREPFVLSLRFPNSEADDTRMATKSSSLDLAQKVIDTLSSVIGAIGEPLPQDIIQDIFTKFSFLNPSDIETWIKPGPPSEDGEEKSLDTDFSGGDFGGGDFGGGDLGGDEADLTAGLEGDDVDLEGEDLGGEDIDIDVDDEEPEEEPVAEPAVESTKRSRERILRERYFASKDTVYEQVLEEFKHFGEVTVRGRHFIYSPIHHSLEPSFKVLASLRSPDGKQRLEETRNKKFVWNDVKDQIVLTASFEGNDEGYDNSQE